MLVIWTIVFLWRSTAICYSSTLDHNTTEYQNVESDPPLVTAYPIDNAYPSAPPTAPDATPVGAANAHNHKVVAGSAVNTGLAEVELGRIPMHIGTCPQCHQTGVITRIKTYPSWETWLVFGMIVLLFWPLCWIPLIMDSVRVVGFVQWFCSLTLCLCCDMLLTILESTVTPLNYRCHNIQWMTWQITQQPNNHLLSAKRQTTFVRNVIRT